MLKMCINIIPPEHRIGFVQFNSIQNAIRARTVLLVLALMQLLQLALYMTNREGILNTSGLILLKVIIIVGSVIFWFILSLLSKGNTILKKHGEPIITIIVFMTLIWSLANTFKAQSITSDISVYLLVLFAISAVVRLRPWIAVVIYGINYIIFFIGIPYYQSNPTYRTSHIMNGLILNIVAFLITYMMFRYSLKEYLDRQSISIKNKVLLDMARHDGLTELYNHQTIHELLEMNILNSQETSEPLSVMLIDLDHFKELNDTFGHKTGDTILKQISTSILKNISSKDMAGRYGGDEFMVILPGSSVDNTREIAMRLLNEIRMLEYNGINLSFSCGIAAWHHESADQLVEKADKVLYRVKNGGRNNVSA